MNVTYITTSPVVTCILDNQGNMKQLFPDLTDEFYDALKNEEEIITDSGLIRDTLQNRGIKSKIDIRDPVLKQWRSNRFQNIMNQTGMVQDFDDYYQKIREAGMKLTFERVKEHSGKKDELIAQIVHSIDDLQKNINLSGNRLQELYALHFPELVDVINNQVTLAKVVASQPKRENLTRELFENYSLPEDKIDLIMSKVDHSMGGNLDEKELFAIQEYARTIIHSQERQHEMEKWIDEQMKLLAPNLTAVAGSNVGARLISGMGSLMKVAKTHASKIQILGAEKALYSSMRGRGTPPKHGIIFQIPEIGNAPYYIRGKLARSFANSIVIAARLDVFDGEFLGEQMRQELRDLEEELRKEADQ